MLRIVRRQHFSPTHRLADSRNELKPYAVTTQLESFLAEYRLHSLESIFGPRRLVESNFPSGPMKKIEGMP